VQLPLAGMDPSTEEQWFSGVRPDTLDKLACIVWTLHDAGPFESSAGQAPRLLKEALAARKGIYQGGRGQSDMHYLLRVLERHGVVEREGGPKTTRRLALVPGVALPPDPYRDKSRAKKPARTSIEPEPEPELSPADALAAVASFAADALRLAGVTGHGAEGGQLAEAHAEIARLHRQIDMAAEQLTDLRKEREMLRRALVQRGR
jgi:hypothetical protein